MYKKIQNENGEKQMSKQKTFWQFKPMITLLVTISGSTAIAVIAVIIYELTFTVEGTCKVHHVAKFTISYGVTASTGIWSILYKASSAIVQEIKMHGTKL